MSEPNLANVQKALDCWYLTGATASGKSKTSLLLAKKLDAEIISLDSMAIYRGMDIGTAKPKLEDREQVGHHLIDIIDPPQQFSVSEYRSAAFEKIDQIRSRGKQVLFVGGTALYLKTLLRGMFSGPPADWEFRKQIQADIETSGPEHLFERLRMVDPLSADSLHPNDHRRIIRALEVYKATGQPISHQQLEFDEGREADQCRVFSIRHRRDLLHQRIEERVDWMFEAGLVDEVERLIDRWGKLGHTASQAVGYREVIEFLQGKKKQEEMVEQVKIRTRRFARHQETWFRGLSECQIIDLDESADLAALADHIFEVGNSRRS